MPGVPHPSLFSSEGWETTNLRPASFPVEFSHHAEGSRSLSRVRRIPRSNLQLFSKTAPVSPTRGLSGLRARTRIGSSKLRICSHRICVDARACPPACRRAPCFVTGNRHPSPETEDLKEAEERWRDSFLATAVLRLQRAFRVEASGKVEIHAPQPGKAWTRGEAGRLAMVQFSALRNGKNRHG